MNLFNYLMAKKGHNTSVRGDLFSYLLGKNSNKLPSDYTKVEYIKNTGGQYIDTGLFPLEISSGKFDISFDEISTGTSYFMGGYYTATSGSNYYSPLLINKNNNKVGLGFAGEWGTSNFTWNLGDRHKVSFTIISGKQTLSIDGDEVINKDSTMERPETTATVPILTYQYQNNRFSAYGWKGKIYSIKLYGNNNELIRNFIPCYRNSDNKPGLYDLVNNVFYTNQGTGDFTYE